jgi:hypothetical protein
VDLVDDPVQERALGGRTELDPVAHAPTSARLSS